MTGEHGQIVDEHTAGAADAHATGTAEGKGVIHIFFDVDKAIQHGHAMFEGYDELLDSGFLIVVRIVSLNFKGYFFHSSLLRACDIVHLEGMYGDVNGVAEDSYPDEHQRVVQYFYRSVRQREFQDHPPDAVKAVVDTEYQDQNVGGKPTGAGCPPGNRGPVFRVPTSQMHEQQMQADQEEDPYACDVLQNLQVIFSHLRLLIRQV
jgi:hypothetical protein